MMDGEKRKALEAAGFRFGDVADFLELTEEERMLIELRLKLADHSLAPGTVEPEPEAGGHPDQVDSAPSRQD